MVLASDYKFYMQEVILNDGKWELVPNTLKDLEKDFPALRYSKAEGINSIGKSRVYTEKYADSDKLRVYVPEEVTNEATKVTFTFYFFGEQRQATFDEFNDYICKGVHRYWDTARNKYFDFILEDEIKISDEMWYGDMPYFEVKYTVQNLNGKTFDVNFI
jgi:hypothetical protein